LQIDFAEIHGTVAKLEWHETKNSKYYIFWQKNVEEKLFPFVPLVQIVVKHYLTPKFNKFEGYLDS
jgi:hypothetical protein